MEVYPKGDPLHQMALGSFGGLGPFTIGDLEAEPGRTLEIRGTLLLGGATDNATISAYGEVTVPANTGSVVALTIDFPSANN